MCRQMGIQVCVYERKRKIHKLCEGESPTEMCVLGVREGDKETEWQFHQLFGIKHKCAGTNSLVQKDAIQFHQQNCAQLYWCIEL